MPRACKIGPLGLNMNVNNYIRAMKSGSIGLKPENDQHCLQVMALSPCAHQNVAIAKLMDHSILNNNLSFPGSRQSIYSKINLFHGWGRYMLFPLCNIDIENFPYIFIDTIWRSEYAWSGCGDWLDNCILKCRQWQPIFFLNNMHLQ